MAKVNAPEHETLFEVRRIITQMETELWEETPCEQCLSAQAAPISRYLIKTFGVKADENDLSLRLPISQLETGSRAVHPLAPVRYASGSGNGASGDLRETPGNGLDHRSALPAVRSAASAA